MNLSKVVSVRYNKENQSVVLSFVDGLQASWPVSLLEMVERTEEGYMPISPSDQELEAVELFGGDSIMWDDLGQLFKIEDLQNHVYGRKSWMDTIIATVLT